MLEWLAGWPIAEYLRRSVWVYPLVNATHILALGALVTSAILMDLRILGIITRLRISEVVGLLRPVAIVSAVFAIGAGFLLFIVKPDEYAANTFFLAKMALLALALLNASIFVLAGRHHFPDSPLTRSMATLSILLWLGVLLSGRLIAFFE